MNLNKSNIDNLPTPSTGYVIHWDENLKGFGLRVTATGIKAFIFQNRINGKDKRITIGRYGELTAEQARKEAKKLAGKIASGGDPIAERKERELKGVSLGAAFADYLKARKDLKRKTLDDYNRIFDKALSDWKVKPMLSITKDMVEKRHTKLGEENGEAWANLSMKVLRAVFNFAMGQYEDTQGRSLITENPVKRLSQSRAWYRVERRQTLIKAQDLAAWFTGVTALPSETLRDYLLLVILTGLRKNEAAKLKWADVDLNGKTLTVRDTQNHSDHTLPLSDFLFELLNRRKAGAASEYVFPGSGVGGYIVEPRKMMAKVTEASGVPFTVHDLRRTFITIAESLDIPAYALKRLLNHSDGADVTACYIVANVERLREPMQKITDYVLKSAGLKATAEVIHLKQARG